MVEQSTRPNTAAPKYTEKGYSHPIREDIKDFATLNEHVDDIPGIKPPEKPAEEPAPEPEA